MVYRCCVPLCESKGKKEVGIAYHKFTNNPKLTQVWIHKIKRDVCNSTNNPKPFRVTKHTKICSKHFIRDDFIIGSERNKLKPNAVPSIFPWTTTNAQKTKYLPDKNNALASLQQPNNVDKMANEITQAKSLVESCDSRKNYTSDKATVTGLDLCYKNVTYNPPQFCLDMFKDNDSDIFYYTGFPTYNIFTISYKMLFEFNDTNLIKLSDRSHQHQLTRENEYFLVTVKLRQNFGYHHLSTLFHIPSSTVCNIFISWINFMCVRLGSLNIWPHRDILLSQYTAEFKESYPNVIGSLDTTKIYIQKQSQTFSHYKNSNAVKALVAVDANGSVIFASALFAGSVSDNVLLQKSGFIGIVENKLKTGSLLAGDTFLADKGFATEELLNPVNISVPVFRIDNTKFSETEEKISRERVHVERAIGRLKNFKILSSVVPLSSIETFNQVWTVCSLLCNFQMPTIKQ